MKLTSREIEVISLTAEGKSCQEISEELDMTLKSLETHRANLLRKTKTKNLPHLVSWFYTRHFEPNLNLEVEYKALQEKYEKLRKLCLPPPPSNRVEHQIHTKEGIPCQGCLTKSAKIRRLEDEVYRIKRTW